MAVAELFLGAFLQVLFDRLIPKARDLWDLALREGLEKKLEKLEKDFRAIHAVLADAEEKQLTDNIVKLWLDDLVDLAYDAEDVLDEFATEALRQKVVQGQASSSRLQNRGFSPAVLGFKIKMKSKIEAITSKLKELSQRRRQLGLVETIVGGGGMSRSNTSTWHHTPSTSLLKETVVYGREDDKNKMIDLLLDDNNIKSRRDLNFDVLPIVGMGGLGKTTLARHVYNDPAMKEFGVKAWVCVSTDFDVTRLTRAILVDVTGQHHELKDLQPIQVKLQAALSGKKFLIVLDDIWEKNYGKWQVLRSPLMVGAPGSRVIVTTRDKEVASMIGSMESHELKLLSADDCWSLFKNHAFENRDISAYPNLKSIREQVVKRCRGLPLAATTLGGLLRHKSMDEWEDVFNSKIWSLSTAESDIFPLLRLSYHNLSPQLKRCFSYCSIFPQDFEFTEEQLVYLWIAEGFILPVDGNQQIFAIGGRYFRELVSRSIFQASSNGASQFVMHDLVHELAEWAASKTCFRLEDNLKIHRHHSGFERARHSSYIRGYNDNITKFEVFNEVKCIRTFLPLSMGNNVRVCSLSNNVLHHIFPKLKKLRVLSLSGYQIYEVPEAIGDLKHLRYFDLSHTCIRDLPESTCSLYNLQSLILAHCGRLRRLPSRVEKLVNLYCLDIKNVNLLRDMPVGLKYLRSLQKLSDFILNKDGGSRIKDLKHLNSLHGSLCISNLASVVDAQDAREANMKEKKSLVELELRWSRGFDDSQGHGNEKQVLEMLQPHRNLEKLTIRCYPRNAFARWLGDPSFFKMKHLKLEDCKRCAILPPLGQLPSLEVLSIQGIGVKSVGAELFGSNNTSKPFPMLKILSFEDMLEWENWNGFDKNEPVESFPQLQELCIKNCPKFLGGLPNHLPSLFELSIRDCPELLGEFPNHLPALKKLEIRNCDKLTVSNSSLLNLQKLVIKGCKRMKYVSATELKKLEDVEIGRGCEEFIGEKLTCSVEHLKLNHCRKLERLPITLGSLAHLKMLHINSCPDLKSLPAVILSSVHGRLDIVDCQNLQVLLEDDIKSTSSNASVLKELHISCCSSLECLSSTGELPTSLSTIRIAFCPKLECIARTLPVSLKHMDISICDRLKLLLTEQFMDSSELESISICDCSALESLPKGLHKLGHLKSIYVQRCSKLISFPEGGLPTSDNLTSLSVMHCEKLTALPDDVMLQNLASLEFLSIGDCPELKLLPEELRFLTNLTRICISGVNICSPLIKCGSLQALISLKDLSILTGCLDISELEIKFPKSLTTLHLSSFPRVENISLNSFQNLTSLTKLTIHNFPKLKMISSHCFRSLTALENLEIMHCPQLKSLPMRCLPLSLSTFSILFSPLLAQRCKREGKYWSYISHIPCVIIDHNSVMSLSNSSS